MRGFALRIASGIAADLRLGESVAVNGVCLTVVERRRPESFSPRSGPRPRR